MEAGERVEVCYATPHGVRHTAGVVRQLVGEPVRSVVVLLDEGRVCVVNPASVRVPAGVWCDGFDRNGLPVRMFVPSKERS